MKKLLLCFLILVSSFSYAVDPIDFGTATPSEIRAYNLKRQQEYIEKTDKSFADLGKKIDQVKASYNAPHIKQTLEKSGILSDGSKVQIKTVVTKPADKAKVAQVLTERLKNAKDYAKNLGKASIPSFVGMAAFHGLMEGIGWVMDEGGKVTKEDNDPVVLDKYTSPYIYQSSDSNGELITVYDINAYCSSRTPAPYDDGTRVITYTFDSSSTSYPSTGCLFKRYFDGVLSPPHYVQQFQRYSNPDYNSSHVPSDPPTSEPTNAEIETAVKNALESNNPALAAAIADAIKSAYSYDGSEGQKPSSNTLAKEAADDMSVALPKAFDNPVPTSNPERPSGYYKITDGDKTVEGYVTPSPIGGTTDTTTTPTIDPVTGQPTGETTTSGGFQLPPFCDWAGIVCDWIQWTKEPYEDEEEFETPIKEIEKKEIKKDLVNASAPSCPADIRFDVQGLPFGISIDKSYQMQPICNTVEPLKYVFQLITFCLCAFMLLRV